MWFFIYNIFVLWVIFVFIPAIKNFIRKFKCKLTLGSWRVYEINNEWECKQACNILKKECQALSVLGFDCEWISQNGVQRPVALLQLASPGGMCGLFRLNKLKKIPEELKQLLSDENIIKLGVTPLTDGALLLKDYDTQVFSTLDLRYLYPAATGLASLANLVLGIQLNKDWRISCSDWESPELTETQLKYAAQDAYVAVEIFKKWLSSQKDYFPADNSGIKLKPKIQKYIDILYDPKHRSLFMNESIKKNVTYLESYANKNEKMTSAARKSPLYDNCFMNAPDGRLLCSCDKKKAQWYVDRGLAKVLTSEPYTIELLFEPAARGDESSNGEFYRQLKQNRCVVCGASESYLKHYVVPKEYRKHFPPIMKDHQSHDIVLMCVKCHYLASRHNEELKKELAYYYNAPIQSDKDRRFSIRRVKNCAKALLAADNALPEEQKRKLENEIKQFYGIVTFDKSLLDKAIDLELDTVNDNKNSHARIVIEHFKRTNGGLKNLEVLFRKHFLDTMNPKYLPTFWSVTHNH